MQQLLELAQPRTIEGIFLVNSETIEHMKGHVVKKYPFFAKWPAWAIAPLMQIVTFLKPDILKMGFISKEIGTAGNEQLAKLWFVGVPFTPRMMKNWFLSWITIVFMIRIIRHWLKRNAMIVGLGGWTAIVRDKGQTIAEKFGSHLAVTTGNAFTALMAVLGLRAMADKVGYNTETMTAAIIGAGGSCGRNCAKLLAPHVKKLFLVGRAGSDISPLFALSAEIMKANPHLEVYVTDIIQEALFESLLVITITSATDVLDIQASDFLPGTIVADAARPRDVAAKIAGNKKIMVIDGAVVEIPDIAEQTWFFGDFPEGIVYACMAETWILLVEGYECGVYSLGDVELEWIKRIAVMPEAKRLRAAGIRSFEQRVTEDRIAEFVAIICEEQAKLCVK